MQILATDVFFINLCFVLVVARASQSCVQVLIFFAVFAYILFLGQVKESVHLQCN